MSNTQHSVTQHSARQATVECGQCAHQGTVDPSRLWNASRVTCSTCGAATLTADLTNRVRMIRQPGVQFTQQQGGTP